MGEKLNKENDLTALMRDVIEARNRWFRSRDKLREVEEKLREASGASGERKRDQALSDYVTAKGKAQQARTRLLKHLKQHAA